MAKRVLMKPDTTAEQTARALSAIDLLSSHNSHSTDMRASRLLDIYFDSKAKLLQNLLSKLIPLAHSDTHNDVTDMAENVLCQIVRLLQYDVILTPHQIFCCNKFTANPKHSQHQEQVLHSMPTFKPHLVTSKVSDFFASHLPLIRTKAEAV
eukprot:CAMPEP_0197829338 /NCGR_PEP_ID=MMETSP1437-20131217/5773_1 /TAXON_ID=49252 ORGANISM="Eucampia antarctica, Strain CCMP1452" /NCGR_SAMPLE_ID=MMETSP1437 /ASSEMBLY_ACC=CAM_ASM_001096 /LENGTH=151 /DNA_ID=CAMNT_0043430933 /DNA_START=143 /DNA_END=594 /DNA_ORIENTATION=+